MRATLIVLLLCMVSCKNNKEPETKNTDPLTFPKENYTVETKSIKTSEGIKEVVFHSYKHISYVSNPVDTDYQSLDVAIPVSINGADIDVSTSPILFNIKVGGYFSVNNKMGGMPGFLVGRKNNDTPNGPPQDENRPASREDLALAEGLVIVTPGCRGHDNKTDDGKYYGKAPAAIVDLKAAVRYIKHNKGIISGNVDRIVSVGCSAGGALSALLGASGNSDLYEPYLKELGAADADDHIFASGCYSPIADLEHADMAYEWMYGKFPTKEGLVDQDLSKELVATYGQYQNSLDLMGKNDFGKLTAENYADYLLVNYIEPSATDYLNGITSEERASYLNENPWIQWQNNKASFNFPDYVAHMGRMKGLPAFDDFDKKQPEPVLFGNDSINASHFTDFGLRHETNDPNAKIDDELAQIVHLMNPMFFMGEQKRSDVAPHWWLRNGTRDNHTSQTVMINIAESLAKKGKDVNTYIFWDGGHCADDDPEGFVKWAKEISK